MKKRLFLSLEFLGKLALATLLPLTVFGILGKLADGLLETNAKFFIAGCSIALISTILWLRILSKKMFKKMEELG